VSSVVLGVEQSDVLQGGQITLMQMFETWVGSGQASPASGITIAITAATTPSGGSGTPLPATGTGLTTPDGATYTYSWLCPAATPPGDYIATWTGTGGLGGSTVLTYSQTVTVAAQSLGAPAPGTYATVSQYQAWSGDLLTPVQAVTTWIQRASEDIDLACIGAVYPVNPNGMPTDPYVIDVLSRACCAQVQFLIADNDPSGVKRQYSQTSVSGVSSTRVPARTALDMPPLCPRALSILHVNGVVPSAALVAW
jgi:hypothetical protein